MQRVRSFSPAGARVLGWSLPLEVPARCAVGAPLRVAPLRQERARRRRRGLEDAEGEKTPGLFFGFSFGLAKVASACCPNYRQVSREPTTQWRRVRGCSKRDPGQRHDGKGLGREVGALLANSFVCICSVGWPDGREVEFGRQEQSGVRGNVTPWRRNCASSRGLGPFLPALGLGCFFEFLAYTVRCALHSKNRVVRLVGFKQKSLSLQAASTCPALPYLARKGWFWMIHAALTIYILCPLTSGPATPRCWARCGS